MYVAVSFAAQSEEEMDTYNREVYDYMLSLETDHKPVFVAGGRPLSKTNSLRGAASAFVFEVSTEELPKPGDAVHTVVLSEKQSKAFVRKSCHGAFKNWGDTVIEMACVAVKEYERSRALDLRRQEHALAAVSQTVLIRLKRGVLDAYRLALHLAGISKFDLLGMGNHDSGPVIVLRCDKTLAEILPAINDRYAGSRKPVVVQNEVLASLADNVDFTQIPDQAQRWARVFLGRNEEGSLQEAARAASTKMRDGEPPSSIVSVWKALTDHKGSVGMSIDPAEDVPAKRMKLN